MKSEQILKNYQDALADRARLSAVVEDLSQKQEAFEREKGQLQPSAKSAGEKQIEAKGKLIAGELSESEYQAELSQLNETVNRYKELGVAIESCERRRRTANLEIARLPLNHLQSDYREAVGDEYIAKYRDDKKFMEKLQELSVLCDICQIREGWLLGDLVGDTSKVREKIIDRYIKQGVVLDLL